MSSAHRIQGDMYQAPWQMKDPGNGGTIYVSRWGSVCPIVTTAAGQTRTLALPVKAGILCTLVLATDGGDCIVTVTGGYDYGANTEIRLSDAGVAVSFLSVRYGTTYVWRILGPSQTYGGPTQKMWSTCPARGSHLYQSLCHEYFNDFRGLAADYDATNEWTVTEDSASCTQAIVAEATGGELLLTNIATTDDNAQQIIMNQEAWKLATGKKLWFEARFKTAAGATQIDWSVGLIEAEDMTGVSDNMPANGVVFKKDDGDTNIDISSSDNGTNLASSAIGTWDTSYHILGFYFDGGATGSGIITPYVDGVAQTAISSVTYATMAELAPFFMVRNGDATTTQTMTIDYVKVVQLR